MTTKGADIPPKSFVPWYLPVMLSPQTAGSGRGCTQEVSSVSPFRGTLLTKRFEEVKGASPEEVSSVSPFRGTLLMKR
jgi:hypothetical protein